ncbi:uncharacterized protein Z520_08492 [Fonsecaea multimorphosa CBS 102226]|uniref:Isochorismatase-like domain-containing protein n=1 Tax=Fonsecaea multimorphosa CBS 102226 TaxID=1442371 RepID=A0A0D2JYZ2_9EURO|nr:uncharacterized protein Z520_08492 [Fonsecaea multimorphosa CBS 102226]KIX95784.1 hypothetical protein Z520_08492 [Fonsecaea multimorphosa CBS 102226]OAL21520.1 hypothetical protein AYO22_07916 [Fonsecaea multimorphosa]
MSKAVFSPSDPASPLSISPHETAVLLMDYQSMTLATVGDVAATGVINIASQMRDWALHKEMTVFHCLVDASPGSKPPNYSRISAIWKMYEAQFVEMPWLAHEPETLAARKHVDRELTVLRTPGSISALESHGLMNMLKEKGIKSLIIGGISTSGCVLSTARAATDHGYIVTVMEDACFDPVPGLHGMLVTHVLPVSAHVATSWEIQNAWKIL